MDSSFDDAVVDLLSGSGGESHIKITSSLSFSLRGTVGLTRRREVNRLV